MKRWLLASAMFALLAASFVPLVGADADKVAMDSRVDRVAQPRAISGYDDRIQMQPADPRVALIEVDFNWSGARKSCTGVIVGYRTVLTAARCLADYSDEKVRTVTSSIWVAPGINGYANGAAPAGTAMAIYYESPSMFYVLPESGSCVRNFAVLVLDKEIGRQTGVAKLGALSSEEFGYEGPWGTTIGYPTDKPWGTQWFTKPQSTGAKYGVCVGSTLDVVEGQEGAPVFRVSDQLVYGLVSHVDAAFTQIAPINEDILAFVDRICQKYNDPCRSIPSASPPTAPTPPESPAPPESPEQPITNDPDSAFQDTWQRTDQPVSSGAVSRTWMWGPQANTVVLQEPYLEGQGGNRNVVYYDKSRMEIATDPNVSPDSPWYVTNGLLATELITGRMQLGNGSFQQYAPAQVNAAGDADDLTGPTYATFGTVLNAPPLPVDSVITQNIDRAGNVAIDPNMANYGVTTAYFEPTTNHTVASVFWDFMNSVDLVNEDGVLIYDNLFENPFYATGLPISEPYWATVKVAGTYRYVLIQAFERRILTYTPDNSPGFEVEAGNVGQHYYRWRNEVVGG